MPEPMPYHLQPGPGAGETTLFVGDGQITILADVATVRRYLAAIGVARHDPAPIAAALEAAATRLTPSRASTFRRLATVLREPGLKEARP